MGARIAAVDLPVLPAAGAAVRAGARRRAVSPSRRVTGVPVAGRARRPAYREASATVITGPNGAGKSTLALTLAGLHPGASPARSWPPSGSPAGADAVRSAGRRASCSPASARCSRSPSTSSSPPTLRDELAVGPRALGMARREIDAVVDELLERLRLDAPRAGEPVHALRRAEAPAVRGDRARGIPRGDRARRADLRAGPPRVDRARRPPAARRSRAGELGRRRHARRGRDPPPRRTPHPARGRSERRHERRHTDAESGAAASAWLDGVNPVDEARARAAAVGAAVRRRSTSSRRSSRIGLQLLLPAR